MKLSIFGLGYVGAVSAACLAGDGHEVVGVDTTPVKVDLIRQGRSPVIEAGVDELMAEAVAAGRLTATDDASAAVQSTDAALVCVGTPSQAAGGLDLLYLRRVCEHIGAALRERSDYYVVVVRSTVLPGTTAETVVPTLEAASGKQAGRDFGVCVYPEFLREGTAVQDYREPPKIVIGALDSRSFKTFEPAIEGLDAPLFETAIPIAEMTKYADNTWHAVKVAFANEIGSLARLHNVDGRDLMEIFASDTKLNISPTYLKPGFAFGGSCLPKDVRALTYRSRHLDLETPLINAVLPSNRRHIERALDLVLQRGNRKLGVLGLSFKAGTDDLRESPMVEIVERLLGKGYDLRIYDRNVNLAKLVGANKEYILNQVPHLAQLMVDSIDEVLEHGDTIVVGNNDPEFAQAADSLREGQQLVDYVRIGDLTSDGQVYHGLCW